MGTSSGFLGVLNNTVAACGGGVIAYGCLLYTSDSKKTDKTTILEYCRSHGIAGIDTPCGGKGTCGKCKVTVTKPYYKDVLAGQTKICDGMEIIVGRKESTGTKEDSMVVLTNEMCIRDRGCNIRRIGSLIVF